jgi:hypothetical protein
MKSSDRDVLRIAFDRSAREPDEVGPVLEFKW